MTFDACALRKMSRSGASCRKMWVAAPQQVTWVRQGHTTSCDGHWCAIATGRLEAEEEQRRLEQSQ
jgi:hypothetical protein